MESINSNDISIQQRKERSQYDKIKILNIHSNNDGPFKIDIEGSRGDNYSLCFNHLNNGGVICTCPDFTVRKNICKHIFFIVGKVSKSNNIFNNLVSLNDFTVDNIQTIHTNLINEYNKVKNNLKNSNISTKIIIENDDNCGVCGISFEETELWKCIECKHVFHKSCLKEWWNTNNSMTNCCAMCRTKNTVIKNDLESIWGELVPP